MDTADCAVNTKGEYVPPPISGYRPLDPETVRRINEVKALGCSIEALVEQLAKDDDTDKRAVSIGRTELQTGLMWLTRSIAKPATFA